MTNIIAQRRALDGAAPSAEQHDEGEGADVMCQCSFSLRDMTRESVLTISQTTSTTAFTVPSTASCSTIRSSTPTP